MTGGEVRTERGSPGEGRVRQPAVAGSFYPGRADVLRDLVDTLLAAAEPGGPLPGNETAAAARSATGSAIGVLVPHAGLVYSGLVAAWGWRALLDAAPEGLTVVILGTNHSANFEGVAVDPDGAWRIPSGDVLVDADVAGHVLALGDPFVARPAAHRDEHSIEVQLPLVAALRPEARIVPCSVAAGTGAGAIDAGERLGSMLAGLRRAGAPVLLAISTDMAHYPAHDDAVLVTRRLAPAVCALDPRAVAALERATTMAGTRGMACGMCGIQPTVLGLAALRAMGASGGEIRAEATSADAGGPPDRTVGYLAVSFA